MKKKRGHKSHSQNKRVNFLLLKYRSLGEELLNQVFLSFGKKLTEKLPKDPGVYRIVEKNKRNETIYIGKSNNLKRRILNNHYVGNIRISTLRKKIMESMAIPNEKKVTNYLSSKCRVQFMVIKDRRLRIYFEHFAIAILRPKFND